MKKVLCLIISLTMLFALASCGGNNGGTTGVSGSETEKTTVKLAVLKGPTGMGAAYLMKQSEENKSANKYIFTIENTPDAMSGQLISGSLDMAAVPTNLAATLKNKGGADIKIIAVNTLGVLYLLEKGNSIKSISDLNGKKVIASGKGSTAEAVIQKLFSDASAEITYAAEHTEAVSLAASGSYDICILPEPFVTTLISKDIGFRVALDLTKEWKDAGLSELTMGAIVARTEFINKNEAAVKSFLTEYASSVEYANKNADDAAALIDTYGIMAKDIAKAAIPNCNMVCITGNEMKTALVDFYKVLDGFNAALIGGGLPADDIYYLK